jgi:OmpA-OmpF porin, OOP family
MKNNIMRFAMATSLSMITLAAFADDMYQGAWYLLPGASILRTDNDLDAKHHGGGFFLKLGKEISPSLDIQGGFTYNRVREETGIPGVGGHYKQISLGADMLYLLNRENFRPFLLIGGGIARNNLDYSNYSGLHDEMRTSWMGNVGLGAQLLFNENVGLQIDIRRQWTKSDAKAVDTGLDTSGTIANTIFNIGGIFRFGTPSPPLKAEVATLATSQPLHSPQRQAEVAPMPEAPIQECHPSYETIAISTEKLFGFDKSHMQLGGKKVLDDIATELKTHPEFELVMVTGYTDRIGSKRYNQLLSERRANEVSEYLISKGVEANRLRSIGKGESEPKVSCTGIRGKQLIECLQPNRRVIIEDQAQHRVENKRACN